MHTSSHVLHMPVSKHVILVGKLLTEMLENKQLQSCKWLGTDRNSIFLESLEASDMSTTISEISEDHDEEALFIPFQSH